MGPTVSTTGSRQEEGTGEERLDGHKIGLGETIASPQRTVDYQR